MDRHLLTHKKNNVYSIPIDEKISDDNKRKSQCEFCGQEIAQARNFGRHLKVCKKKVIINQEDSYAFQLKEMNDELEKCHEIIKHKDLVISNLQNNFTSCENLIAKTELPIPIISNVFPISTKKQPISKMVYIKNSYPNAPVLKPLADYSLINECENDYAFVEKLVCKYDSKQFVTYISEVIVEKYKKIDPKKQSIWISDLSRLSYIISVKIDDDIIWHSDKKGIKTRNLIIKPLLNYIELKLRDYNANTLTRYHKKTPGVHITTLEIMRSVNDIIEQIEENDGDKDKDKNKDMCENILRCIAPHFSEPKLENRDS
jgi:hypothetical protein